MKHLTILIGPPGSGKSTFAHSMKNTVRVSQDDMGKEKHKQVFSDALKIGADIVLDRMNFNKQQRAQYIKEAKAAGYTISSRTFFVSHETCFDRMSNREDHPTIKTPENALNALYTFYSKFEYPTLEEGFDKLEETKEAPLFENCIVVDIDNTVADGSKRQHYLQGPKKDWKSFLSECDKDTPKMRVIDLIFTYILGCSNLGKKVDVVFSSGRGNEYRTKTEDWLIKYDLFYKHLFMRQERDYRPDFLVKEIILDFEILTRYKNPLVFFDDREQVVEMLRRRGQLVMAVENGKF